MRFEKHIKAAQTRFDGLRCIKNRFSICECLTIKSKEKIAKSEKRIRLIKYKILNKYNQYLITVLI